LKLSIALFPLIVLFSAPAPSPDSSLSPPDPAVSSRYDPPNILVILVDDLGIDQLHAYRDENRFECNYPYAHTPAIDRLAEEGILFTQARATPLCSPTRAELQSGRYGRRTGCGTVVLPWTNTLSFCALNESDAPDYTLLGKAIRECGYSTGMFGKLHLNVPRCERCVRNSTGEHGDFGTGINYAIDVLGYDHYEGIRSNPDDDPPEPHEDDLNNRRSFHSFTYYYHDVARPLADGGPYRTVESGAPCICQEEIPECGTGGCVSATCSMWQCYNGVPATRKQRLALQDWIGSLSGPEPFFAMWNVNDLHGPLDWLPEYDDAHPDVEGHGFGEESLDTLADPWFNTRIRAKLEYFDSSLGLLRQELEATGQWRNTVVFLLGDNGTEAGEVGAADPRGVINIKEGELPYPPDHVLAPLFDPGDCALSDGRLFTMEPYQGERMKGSVYEGGVRVPLIVKVPAPFPGHRVTDALVDVVDIHETLREIALGLAYSPASPPCTIDQRPSDNCTDSISFACCLRGLCSGADDHARQNSHASIFFRNSYPPAPELTPNRKTWAREYYLRRERGDRGTFQWKIVRNYRVHDSNPPCYVDEFYEVLADPLELDPVDLTDPDNLQAYLETKTEFDLRFPPFFPECSH
jgi:arylsulfatase A-like enzyme